MVRRRDSQDKKVKYYKSLLHDKLNISMTLKILDFEIFAISLKIDSRTRGFVRARIVGLHFSVKLSREKAPNLVNTN